MRKKHWAMVGVASLMVWQMAGCVSSVNVTASGGGPIPDVDVDFDLGAGLGEFEVQAGVPLQKTGTGSFQLTGIIIGTGSLAIAPAAVTVTPTNPAGNKGTVNLQVNTLQITAWIGPIDDLDTVCETGEQYGPYLVTLDEDFNVVSISPETLDLSATTVTLLNSGEFSLCIEVESTVDATIEIARFSFNLSV